MNNTIEKALARQKAAELEKSKQSEQASMDNVDAKEAKAPAMQANSIEKASAKQQKNVIAGANSAVISAPDAPEEVINLDKIINIDVAELERKGFVSLTSARSRINEEYREIKRKLLKNAFGFLSSTINRANIIMVTSARPSEGKTFTAVNLAMSIAAEKDKTVLLVDADVLKPNVMRTLGEKTNSGLMEYLIGEKENLAEVIYPTNIDKLKIIPAGRSHHLSTELLASKKMEDTIEEFSSRYSDRVVIIDTPPMLGINESAILAGFAGQAVVVVEEGRAKLTDIRKAVDRLDPEMAVGFVVNKSTYQSSDDSGYYGYYYGSEEN